MVNRDTSVRGVLLSLVFCVTGCINTPLPDYYMLTPEPSRQGQFDAGQLDAENINADNNVQVNEVSKLSDLAVGVGPITIPETVNRPNIVTPRNANQLEVSEFHRWSEPLRENISRVVITNLADRMGVSKLYAYPWLRAQIDNIARIDVLQMNGEVGREVYLQVRWQILSGSKPHELLDTRITEYRQAVSGGGYSSLVAAYSAAYASLSDDIAQALSEINGASDAVADANSG